MAALSLIGVYCKLFHSISSDLNLWSSDGNSCGFITGDRQQKKTDAFYMSRPYFLNEPGNEWLSPVEIKTCGLTNRPNQGVGNPEKPGMTRFRLVRLVDPDSFLPCRTGVISMGCVLLGNLSRSQTIKWDKRARGRLMVIVQARLK